MYTLGIDVGSASSKAVILEDGKRVAASAVIQSGTGTSGPGRVMELVFDGLDISQKDMDYIVATGYGRFAVPFANKQMSEITCHAKGIHHLIPDARTIMITPWEKKIIKEMGDAHFKADCPANVSSTCTVFAESEVISQLSKGVSKENIAAGVHRSIASKACSLVYRVGMEEKVVMCGGVAQDKGVVDAIEQELKKKILVADNPQTTGALGAALIAFELAGKSS